ncbi:TetR-like C-terminal domain-containing protein [Streptomyces sp. NPDC002012]|uniref:TetR-like C-terminal domain-containing protein n=1 Tax=Streptomyces sp. NPDC002012 TaxID=3154532 RepID=UPI0033319E2C
MDRWLVSVGLGAGHEREATSSDLLAATSFAAGTAEHRQASGILCTLMAEARIGAGFGERLRTGFLERRRDVLRTVLDRAAHRGDLPARPAPSTVLDVVFGTLWYRALATRHALGGDLAEELRPSSRRIRTLPRPAAGKGNRDRVAGGGCGRRARRRVAGALASGSALERQAARPVVRSTPGMRP